MDRTFDYGSKYERSNRSWGTNILPHIVMVSMFDFDSDGGSSNLSEVTNIIWP